MFIILISVGVGTASALITITLAGDVIITGFLDMTGDKITNVDTPTQSSDAATKGYVDSGPSLYIVEEELLTNSLFPSIFATCDSGDLVTGGGSSIIPATLSMINEFPSGNNEWINRFDNPDQLDVKVTAFAICLDLPPLRP